MARHCWGHSDAEVAANLKLWAEGEVGPLRAVGFKTLTQFSRECLHAALLALVFVLCVSPALQHSDFRFAMRLSLVCWCPLCG